MELAARPVEFRGREVPGVEQVLQERVQVFLLDRALDREWTLARQRRDRALASQVARPHEQPVNLLPRGGNRAVAAKQAYQVVDAVEVDEPGGEPWQAGPPSPISLARRRCLEPRVIREDEAVADVERRLPEAVGELGRAVQIFEGPCEDAALVDRQRAIEKDDRGNPVEVERGPRVPQPGELTDDVFLTADHISAGRFRNHSAADLRVCSWSL